MKEKRCLSHQGFKVPLEDIFKLSASAAASEFCEWLQDGIDVYISLIKSIRSSLTYLHRNHFFRLHQTDKSSESKVKFKQAS